MTQHDSHKTYLGDGVYVEKNPDQWILLSTENGLTTTNMIILEPEIFAALARWCERHIKP